MKEFDRAILDAVTVPEVSASWHFSLIVCLTSGAFVRPQEGRRRWYSCRDTRGSALRTLAQNTSCRCMSQRALGERGTRGCWPLFTEPPPSRLVCKRLACGICYMS